MEKKMFCPLEPEDEAVVQSYLWGLTKEEALREGGYSEKAVKILKHTFFQSAVVKDRIEEIKTDPEYVEREIDELRKLKQKLTDDDLVPKGGAEYVKKRLRDIVEKCTQDKLIKIKDREAYGRFNPEGATAALKLLSELEGHLDKKDASEDTKIPAFEIILSEKKG